MKKAEKKKMRQGMAYIMLSCVVAAVAAFLPAEKLVYAATCPGKSNSSYAKQTEWQCGCKDCGGSVWYNNEVDRYEAPTRYDKGSGLNSREETEASGTTWRVYYRCSNCGDAGYDCKAWAEEVYRVFVSTTNNSLYGTVSRYTENAPFTGYASGSAAAGYIPWYYCSFCARWGDGRALHNDCPTIEVKAFPLTGGSVGISGEPRVGNICAPNSIMELTATAAAGFEFEGWSVGGTESSLMLTMDASKSVTAYFYEKAEITKVPEVAGSPQITEIPPITVTPEITAIATPTTVPTPTKKPTAVPTPTSTPRPTSTPMPTNTPRPTSMPTPTSTPRPTSMPMPTNTPRPTSTPMPTNTPRPTSTPMPTRVPTVQVRLDDKGATGAGHTKEVVITYGEYGPDIHVPEKTGYSFQGYFTETKGTGTRYYDAGGICVKPWEEAYTTVLYAYWQQKPVVYPEEDLYEEPECLPELVIEGNVHREDARALLYADDYNFNTGALDDLQPYLVYDTPGAEGLIPGTEFLSFRAVVPVWRLQYKFYRYTGTDMVKVIVTVPYRTQYEKANEELVISERKIKEYTFLVPKVWSYWSVEESGMYYPDRVTVTNDALKEKEITVMVNYEAGEAVEVPEYSVLPYGDKRRHVQWPEYDADGIPVLYLTLEKEEYIISEKPDTLPDVEAYLSVICKNAAWDDEREAKVRSDRYEFNGEVVLSDDWKSKNGSAVEQEKLPVDAEEIKLTSYLQTYKSGIELEELKPNGRYGTTAEIIYIGDKENIGVADTRKETLADINSLNIHTPVACKGIVAAGTKEGILTLKEALNSITLRIDNFGTHRMNFGYGTKNFARALSGKSNMAEQQIRFPFDVYVENERVAAGNWITMEEQNRTFQVPITQKNGTYQVELRTIAVNCPRNADGSYQTLSLEQEKANTDASRYIATDSMKLDIRSCLWNFEITGTNDPAAERNLDAGSQALVLKTGYEFSYELQTRGEFYGENTEWSITPKFYWVSKDESERKEVELYGGEYSTKKESRECYALKDSPLLEQQENSKMILQTFSGSGCIPVDVCCISADGKTEDGYLVVSFDIKVKSEEGVWYTFEHWESTELYKAAVAAGWNYAPGDVVRYDLSKSVADDYEIGGVE